MGLPVFDTQFLTKWHRMSSLGIIAVRATPNNEEHYTVGPIAQSVEQRTFNPWVDGSSPSGPTVIQSNVGPLGEFFMLFIRYWGRPNL